MNNQTQLTTQKKENFFAIDIIKVVLAIVILNYHCYKTYFSVANDLAVGGGKLACEAFFMISGFFCARSAAKNDSLPWYKYIIRRAYKMLPMIILVWVEGCLFSGLLYAIQGKQHFFLPFCDANTALWFVWGLWIGELILYPILKYSKNNKLLWIILILIFTLGGYILSECIRTYPTSIRSWNFTALATIEIYLTRNVSNMAFGVLIWFIYNATQEKQPNKAIKTISSIIYFLCLGAIFYLMFWWYDTPFIFLLISLFFISLMICFCKFGWIAEKIILPKKVSQFCKTYSTTLYYYHHAIATLFACFYNLLSAKACGASSIIACLIFSVPMYYLAPMFTKFVLDKTNKLINYIKSKKQKNLVK